MPRILCFEACRLEIPAELKGDYARHAVYDDARLAMHYPQFFCVLVEPIEPSLLDAGAAEEAIPPRRVTKKKDEEVT